METPTTRYVTTVDGVRIAYWTMGEGEPFVYLSGWPFEHIELELQRAVDIELYGHLSQHRMLVRYDGRGAGMSEREVEDVSLTARVLDLAAVVGQLETRPIALVGFATSAPVAIVFAARHPELVSRLVLYDAHADLKSLSERPQIKAVTGLMSANYEMFTETLGSLGYGYSSDQARAYAAFVRACTSKEMAIRAIEEMAKIDVTHLLPALTMPVMVLQHREVPYNGEGTATALAEAILGAELVFLEGSYGTNPAAERGPIAEFLGAPPLDPTHLRTVTIMFTDIVDSTVTIQRLGDEKAQELVRAHNGIVRDALKANYGNEVKHTGDGIMASFLSAPRALDAAIQIQRAVEQYNATAETALELRLGVNAGQPVMEEDDFFGSAVNMAARVCRASEAGQILVTDYVRELAGGPSGDAAFTFVNKGPATLRGFEEPIPLFAVEWRN